jgi:hypothetical protein
MMNYDYPMILEKKALVTFSHLKTIKPGWEEMSKSFNKHHKKSEGRCWMDLTVDSGTKGRWPIVKVIRDRYSRNLNLDIKFHVWLIDPWMVHIEMTEEEEGWTAQEVLSLPDWFMVGGTFEEDALRCGYREEFLKHIMVYSIDKNSWISESSTEGLKSSTSGSSLIQHLAENDPVNFLDALRANLRNIKELSRVDMEVIARMSNCLCFSACVSSSDDFKDDIMSGTNFGDTIDTWERFINNEEYKGRLFVKDKMLYFDVDHISRYDFDGAHTIKMYKLQAVLEECWIYKKTGNRKEKDEALKKLLAFANKKEKNKMIWDDVKTWFGITVDVESGVGVSS